MDRPPPTLLIVLLIFIFFAPNQQTIRYNNSVSHVSQDVEKLQDFDALANSTYGDLTAKPLNLTGFRDSDEYHLDLFPKAQELSNQQYVDAWYDFPRQSPMYHDIEGRVKGDFKRVDLGNQTRQALNLSQIDPGSEYLTRKFDRNVTDATGQLELNLRSLDDFSKYTIREVKADLSIHSDSSPGDGWLATVRGLQFPSGLVVMTTSSRKFNALPALPHFALSEQQFERATIVMNKTLTDLWKRIEQSSYDDNIIVPTPKCELVVWLHQKPMFGTRFYIDEIEQELLEPDGAPIGVPPPLAFAATILSPDCAFILQADTLHGPKVAAYNALWRRLTVAFCIVIIGQIALLRRQMHKCATPSTRSRVSYHAFGIAAFADGLQAQGVLTSLIMDFTSLTLTGTLVLLCFIQFFLGVRFVVEIWMVQVGEPAATENARQRRALNNRTSTTTTTEQQSPSISATQAPTHPPTEPSIEPTTVPPPVPLSEAGLPLPATARTSNTNPTVILTPDQDGDDAPTPRSSSATLFSRFWFALVNFMFFTLWALSWPRAIKHAYFNLLAFTFFSMWTPQIYRNIMRNCRKALDWEFVIGTSILRAVPVLYWYIDEKNILWTPTSPRTAAILAGWLVLQILVLLSQQYLGPRLFVPESKCPPAYDYHPILYDDLEAGGLPIGEITSASEGKDKDMSMEPEKLGLRKVFDCAICMNEIDVPVVSKDEKQKSGSSRSWLEQRTYMVTPCRHIFHSECLEGWMNLRLACPVCRESLPPL